MEEKMNQKENEKMLKNYEVLKYCTSGSALEITAGVIIRRSGDPPSSP